MGIIYIFLSLFHRHCLRLSLCSGGLETTPLVMFAHTNVYLRGTMKHPVPLIEKRTRFSAPQDRDSVNVCHSSSASRRAILFSTCDRCQNPLLVILSTILCHPAYMIEFFPFFPRFWSLRKVLCRVCREIRILCGGRNPWSIDVCTLRFVGVRVDA